MIADKSDALHILAPTAKYRFDEDNNLVWEDENVTEPSENDINLAMAQAQQNIDAVEYKTLRRIKYLDVEQQLDQLYWDKKNGTDVWVEAIDAVKTEFPKP